MKITKARARPCAFLLASATMLCAGLTGIKPSLAADERSTSAQSDRSETLAVVNGEELSLEVVERKLANLHGAIDESSRSTYDLDQLLFRSVNDLLIAQEARALEMDQEEAIVKRLAEYRTELAVRKMDSIEIWPKAIPTEEEIREVFEDQYKRVTFRVVTAYEREGSEELLKQLRDGADMEALAKERSVDPYRLRGGLVDDIVNFDLQRDIAAIVFSLEPGELSGPIRTDLGWSLVRVESFAAPDEARFPALQRDLAALVRQRKALETQEVLTDKLRAVHPVKIDQETVAALEPERAPDSRIVPRRPEDPVAVVASIGTDQVLAADEYFNALRARWKRVRNVDAAEAAAPIVLDRLIRQKLMLAEAMARGYDRLPEVDRAVRAYETEMLIPTYLEEVLAPKVEVSESEKLAFYEERKQESHRPPRIRLGQITVATQQSAEEIAAQLRDGADLAWLAKSRSIDRLGEKGGERGWYIPQPGIDDFNADLMEAPVGTVLEPFGAAGNWIVLKVVERQEQGIFSYEEISGNVAEAVFKEKFAVALDEFVKTLRSRAEIEVNEAALESLQIEGSQSHPEGQGDHGGHGH